MSHLVDLKTQVTDRIALIRALERAEMGFKGKVEQFDKAVNIKSSYDSTYKKANIVVRSKNTGINADMGWEEVRDANGRVSFVQHVDEYHYHGAPCYDKTWQNKLYTYYGVEKSKLELEKRKIQYTEDKDPAGRPRIVARFTNLAQEQNMVSAGRFRR